MTFAQCVEQCYNTPELVEQFDRLWGTNLSRKGSPIEVEIDYATGRTSKDMWQFIDFVRWYIWDLVRS